MLISLIIVDLAASTPRTFSTSRTWFDVVCLKSTPLVVSNDEIKVDDAEGVTVIEALVFPQQIKTGYNIDLEYRTSDNSSLRQVTVDLSSLSVNEWNAGNQYRYSFTITPDDRILFDKPTVNKWDEATGGIIIVE